MFTGIIEGQGKIKRLTRKAAAAFLEVDAAIDLGDVAVGDSIAVNGACLTVTTKTGKTFGADVSAETLDKTTIKLLQTGDEVNLEKALRLGGFAGGHFVLGHVDAVSRILSRTEKSGSLILGIAADEKLSLYIVEKGSVAIDGVSLTVNKLEKSRFYVNIIPHTASRTTLISRKQSDLVNIETDILGKYVEKLMRTPRAMDNEFLARHGFAGQD